MPLKKNKNRHPQKRPKRPHSDRSLDRGNFLEPVRLFTPYSSNEYQPDLFGIFTEFSLAQVRAEATWERRLERDTLYRVLLHEQAHHLQYVSTTYGIFSCLGGLAISRFMVKIIEEMSREHWDTFCGAFPSGGDAGIWEIDHNSQSFQNIRVPKELPGRAHWTKQISLEYALQFLRDDTALASTKNSMGTFMANALVLLDGFAGLSFPKIVFDAPPTDDPMLPGQSLYRFQDDFTTVHLLEAAATATDYLAAASTLSGESEEAVEKYAHGVALRLFDEHHVLYNKAFRQFLQTHPGAGNMQNNDADADTFRNSVFTFLVLADMALNPPLPPVYVPRSDDWQSVSWSALHPPIRFLRFLEVASQMELLSCDSDPTAIGNYMGELCHRAHLRSFSVDALTTNSQFALWSRKDAADTFSLPESYVVRTFSNFAAVRKASPGFTSALGLLVRQADVGEQLRAITGNASETLLAPFSVDCDGAFHSYFDEPDSTELAAALAARNALRRMPSLGPVASQARIPPEYRSVMSEAEDSWAVVQDIVHRYVGHQW